MATTATPATPVIQATYATPEAVATHLGVPARTIRYWSQRGLIPAVRIGGRWLIDVAALRVQLAQRPRAPTP